MHKTGNSQNFNPATYDIVNEIISLKDFSPSPSTNELFSNLVSAVIKNPYLDNYIKNDIEKIRDKCEKAEFELEKYWAKRIAKSLNPKLELGNFPYLENYRELTKREIDLITSSGFYINKNTRCLFVGSGPLPLSIFEVAYQVNCKTYGLDLDQEAIELSQKTSEKLGIDINFIHSNAEIFHTKDKFDLIFIAALAGKTIDQKQAITDNLLKYLNQNGRLIMRSARNSRRLLYPDFNIDDIKNLKPVIEYHPEDEIINSVFIYKKEDK